MKKLGLFFLIALSAIMTMHAETYLGIAAGNFQYGVLIDEFQSGTYDRSLTAKLLVIGADIYYGKTFGLIAGFKVGMPSSLTQKAETVVAETVWEDFEDSMIFTPLFCGVGGKIAFGPIDIWGGFGPCFGIYSLSFTENALGNWYYSAIALGACTLLHVDLMFTKKVGVNVGFQYNYYLYELGNKLFLPESEEKIQSLYFSGGLVIKW